MSDIHGRYDEYKRMLELIDFRSSDTLFILGDVVDRCDKSMELIIDLMYRENVVLIAGNHDFIAFLCLKMVINEISNEFIDSLEKDEDSLAMLIDWLNNLHGNVTFEGFCKLSNDDREAVIEYLEDVEFYQEIEVNGVEYVLVHTMGYDEFDINKDLDDYSQENLLDIRCDYTKQYYPDKILVTGHTPTRMIPGNKNPNKIYKENNHIALDCGMESLGCICLDTMQEYYI